MAQFFIAAHALIEKDGKYLVTKRSATDDYMPGLWDIPGGTAEEGERIEDTLQREVLEESGLQVKVKYPLYIYTNLGSLPERQYFQSVYLCSFVSGEIVLNLEDHDEYQWLSLHEIKDFPCIAFLQALLESDSIHMV